MAELEAMDTRYDPSQCEQKWYRAWEERDYFHAEPDDSRTPYVIVIPPPNVTGVLTMGHVLNNTIQDILIRWRRMQGRQTLWMPGTDHAGIATQNVVERELAGEGLSREQLGREAFLERVWQKKEQHVSIITDQLKRLGCSCDWARERFTMDEGLSRAVTEVFVSLYEEGLVYRDQFIINWCPRCSTAISDDEAEHRELEGKLYYIKYPIRDSDEHITVATTRPETMLGDTGVAVNPADERFQELRGKTVVLPVIGRELPVVEDEFVDPGFGTGIVKVTPAHDPNDFEMGGRHDLERVVVIGEDGRMTEAAGKYEGLDRFECRAELLRDLEEQGLLDRVEDHAHAVAHCYRCDTVIEPYLSMQWFVKMKPLAQPAIRAAKDGRVTFYPPRWTAVYYNWLENVRDWCISRQIWWGHRIPAWECQDCSATTVARTAPTTCGQCGSANLVQEEDVLDTWFSSWLWPFSTLGWPEQTKELAYFYPTNTLVTAPDIIFFWVARMIMSGLQFMSEVPFSDVYLHGVVRDATGRKMSKSLGNSPDPIAVIDQFGADALRFSIILITAQGQDAFYSEDKVEIGRNFANKIWNAARLILLNLGDEDVAWPDHPYSEDDYQFEDKWILSRMTRAVRAVTTSLDKYTFNDAARAIYEFTWHELCDWYLEFIKPRLYAKETDSAARSSRRTAQRIAAYTLDNALRLLHPFMPYLTEEIWYHLGRSAPVRGRTLETQADPEASVMISQWPEPDEALEDDAVEESMQIVQDIIKGVRNIRNKMNIPEKQELPVIVSLADNSRQAEIEANQRLIAKLAGAESMEIGIDLPKPESSSVQVVGRIQVFVPLAGVIDVEAERERLESRLQKLRDQMVAVSAKLANHDFLAAVVAAGER